MKVSISFLAIAVTFVSFQTLADEESILTPKESEQMNRCAGYYILVRAQAEAAGNTTLEAAARKSIFQVLAQKARFSSCDPMNDKSKLDTHMSKAITQAGLLAKSATDLSTLSETCGSLLLSEEFNSTAEMKRIAHCSARNGK